MEEIGLPFAGYVFIGVTTLVLTYVTLMDTSSLVDENAKSKESSISLPTLPSLNPYSSAAPVVAVPIGEQTKEPSILEKLNPFSKTTSNASASKPQQPSMLEKMNPFSQQAPAAAAAAGPAPPPPQAPSTVPSTSFFGNLFGQKQPEKKVVGGKKKTKAKRRKQQKSRKTASTKK